MFAKTIIDSDAFMDMPLSSQALYFHLSMRGDDDGFINNPKKIQRMIGASDDDFKVLVAKRFIIPFDSGIVVVKHWKIHNYIRGDRKKETVYPEEMSLLTTKENGAYSLVSGICHSNDSQMTVKCLHRVVEDNLELGKNRVVVSIKGGSDQLHCLNDKQGKGVVYLTDEQDEALMEKLGVEGYDYYISKLADFIINKNATVKNHYETILKWYNEDSKVNV